MGGDRRSISFGLIIGSPTKYIIYIQLIRKDDKDEFVRNGPVDQGLGDGVIRVDGSDSSSSSIFSKGEKGLVRLFRD